MENVEQQVAIEQVAKWLEAWSVDQAYIASRAEVGSERRKRFEARAEALADAARDLLTSDIWDTACFVQADGTYPERKAA